MRIEEALVARIDARVAGLAGRVRPAPLPEAEALPAATWQQIAGYPEASGASPAQYWYSRYQVTVWSGDALEALVLAQGVADALLEWRETLAGLVVQDSHVIGMIDLMDQSYTPPVYGRAVEAWVWWVEG